MKPSHSYDLVFKPPKYGLYITVRKDYTHVQVGSPNKLQYSVYINLGPYVEYIFQKEDMFAKILNAILPKSSMMIIS